MKNKKWNVVFSNWTQAQNKATKLNGTVIKGRGRGFLVLLPDGTIYQKKYKSTLALNNPKVDSKKEDEYARSFS